MEQYKDEGESAIAGKQQGEEGQVTGNLLCQFEQILHDDPLMYVLFLHIITKAINFFVFAVFFSIFSAVTLGFLVFLSKYFVSDDPVESKKPLVLF
jgi:hypothetical protein